LDSDVDGLCDDFQDDDNDGDGVDNSNDFCPGHDDGLDLDGNGIPDGCDSDTDWDFDGIPNDLDECDETPVSEIDFIGPDGCGPSESGDDDNDGVANTLDDCPETPTDETPNSAGCGPSQRDSDGDGWNDAQEQGCGHDYLDADDVPDKSCGASQKEENSPLMDLSCWIFLILLLIVILAIAMLLASRRDEDGKITINIMGLRTAVSGDDDDDPFANLEGEVTPEPSSVDDWDDEPLPALSSASDEADAKMAEMDAKMAEMDDKMAKLSEKEAQLARIAAKAEEIDFATIGTASVDDKNDLRRIKGIGPFIEEKLNALGIFTFAQLSNMTPEIEEQVNEAIEFFPGRIKRDKWANQATEFDSEEEESELPKMSELVSEDENDEESDDDTFDDVDWE
jgi:predicted flap endonuclease-1-like 5' DNA nuclease